MQKQWLRPYWWMALVVGVGLWWCVCGNGYVLGETELMRAAYQGDMAAVERLLERPCPQVNATEIGTGRNALELAALEGHLDVVIRLIAADADVNARGGIGQDDMVVFPVLHAAIRNDNYKAVEKLRISGIVSSDARKQISFEEVRQLSEFKALKEIYERNRLEIVKTLVAFGADVNVRDRRFNSTPLMGATEIPLIAEYLIKHGANVNAQNGQGVTPLMFAVGRGSVESVRLLLSSGADVSLMDVEGKTAIDRARKYGHTEIVSMLEDYEKQRNATGIAHP